jgi:tRNA/rRNA methyltransferase
MPCQLCMILVNPSLSQNIGSVARAMLNFGLQELRLVNPKKDWLNQDARSLAADADIVLDQAKVFITLQDALQDLQVIYATTARPRDLNKEIITPAQAAQEILHFPPLNYRVGILFGSEKCGLDNDHIALSHKVITIPLNPNFTSINLAQSLVIVAYELFQTQDPQLLKDPLWQRRETVAPYEELLGFFDHLETELQKSGYFRPAHKAPVMTRNLRNLFTRAHLSSQEVRTLRGVISSLVNPNGIYSRKSKRKKRGENGSS